MKAWIISATAVSAALLTLSGCNIGMAPKGPDRAGVIANMNKLPPDQEIALIEHGPGTKAYKDKMIADIKARAGKTP